MNGESIMTELYEISGPTFRLPAWVKWTDSLGEIDPGAGLPLLNCQQKALLDLLTVHHARPAAGKLFIFEADLKMIGRKSNCTDPEEVVEWLPGRKPVESETTYRTPDEFVAAYCRSNYALFRDPLIMDALWLSLCKFMLHWFLNEQKELSLGFVRLVPLCFRQNWSNCAAKFEYKMFKKNLLFRSSYMNQDHQNMIERGVADYLCSTGCASFDIEKRVLRHTLDVVLNPEWHETANRIEYARKLARNSKYAYWKGTVPDRLRRQLPRALEVYAAHLAEAAVPTAPIYRSNASRLPSERSWEGKAIHAVQPTTHWGETGSLYPLGTPDKAESLAEPNEMVLEALSDLQSPE